MAEKSDYGAESIKVLEGLEGVRKRFDLVELSRKIKKKGDLLILSKELKVRPSQGDTEKLIEIIKPFIPKCMLYKIGERND